jgi:hypothetical protein
VNLLNEAEHQVCARAISRARRERVLEMLRHAAVWFERC